LDHEIGDKEIANNSKNKEKEKKEKSTIKKNYSSKQEKNS